MAIATRSSTSLSHILNPETPPSQGGQDGTSTNTNWPRAGEQPGAPLNASPTLWLGSPATPVHQTNAHGNYTTSGISRSPASSPYEGDFYGGVAAPRALPMKAITMAAVPQGRAGSGRRWKEATREEEEEAGLRRSSTPGR
ncbi:hypothetical protein MAPG_10634 [Magnaporthiopsis poae ATCC 64411]|uniref:Uncharacterized protein n=1 Tax=Magnaporthiopsis poae (strain ATCC 64411 / 73-15) TaxID=644358 RepID=A0A0C4ED41_MAGP6|nr:hypothetical protein MAPG_10634 [Magnaporthiopsis poae ATCC 64411]